MPSAIATYRRTIDENIALCVFRVAQEALGNAVKHSDAGHIWVDLTGGPSSVALTITDDGKGFDVNGPPNAGLGLISMRERVESVGGVLEIHATPASGTRLTVTVPIQASELGTRRDRVGMTTTLTLAVNGAAGR